MSDSAASEARDRTRVGDRLRSLRASLPAFAERAGKAPAFALFCALLLADIAYRLLLLYRMTTDPVTPFSFMPVFPDVTAFVRCFAFDWSFLAGLCLGLGVLGAVVKKLAPLRARPWLAIAGWAGLTLIAGLIGLDTGVHFRTLLAMHAGFDASMLIEALSDSNAAELLRYGTLVDVALAILPLALLAAFARMPERYERTRRKAAFALSVICLLAYLPYLTNPWLHRPKGQLNAALRWAPAYYMSYFAYHRAADATGENEARAERLPVIPHFGLFLNTPPPPPSPPARPAAEPGHEAYNVVLIIMESVGAGYAFDTHEGNALPMPRLQELMRGGLELSRHYTSSNTSPRAIFSLYTGLYPQPTPAMFVTRPDIYIPGIGSYLGAKYEKFFVTPGRLRFYLPRAMLEHDGLREMYGYEELPIKNPLPMPGFIGRNEIQTVDFFLGRMRRAKEPFFSIYYSFAPHYDYYDHGPAYRIFQDLKEPRHRYYNNLRLLDTQIGRIVDELAAEGRLERTVLIVVGDHGEGFGQHPGNLTHSRHSFEENLRTPALFWQPRLFPPGRVGAPSSHIDVLPTLLDALRIPYDRTKVQGVSLAGNVPAREYVYVYGNENTVSSIRDGKLKLQISLPRDRCVYFDLARDRLEHDKRPCDPAVDAQRDNLLEFWQFQRHELARYNASLQKPRP